MRPPRLDPNRPKVPDVVPIALAYRQKPGNYMGGNLHIVLEDDNIDDGNIEFCIDRATETGDQDGVLLGELLLKMSKTGRAKVCDVVGKMLADWDRANPELANANCLAPPSEVALSCARCSKSTSGFTCRGYMPLAPFAGWYFSTETGWLCPACKED